MFYYPTSYNGDQLKWEQYDAQPITASNLSARIELLNRLNSSQFSDAHELSQVKNLATKIKADCERFKNDQKIQNFFRVLFKTHANIHQEITQAISMADKITQKEIIPQEKLIQQAKELARQDPEKLSQTIHLYVIKDEKARLEIALISNEVKLYRSRGSYHVIKNIKNFGFCEANRIHLAKLYADINPGDLVREIENFDILNPNALLEIAKEIEKSRFEKQSFYNNIAKFKIQDEHVLIEFLKRGAESDPYSCINHVLPNIGLKNQKALVEIAKIAMDNHANCVAEGIKGLKIIDEKDRIELAKIAVSKSYYNILKLDDFEITDKKALLDIAKGHIRSSFFLKIYDEVCRLLNVQKFNTTERLEIFLEMVKESPKDALRLLHHFGLNIKQFPLLPFLKIDSQEAFKELKQHCPNDFKEVVETISKFDPVNDQKKLQQSVEWLIMTLSRLSVIPQREFNPDLISSLFNYRDPIMRYELTLLAAPLFEDAKKMDRYKAFITHEHMRLPALFLSKDPSYDPLRTVLKEARYLREGPMLKMLMDTIPPLQNSRLKPE